MELQSFTRKQLYDLVWKEPIQLIAPKFGLSDRGLAKLCDRHAIPTPPRGYWAKKQAGRKVAKAPLLELEGSRIRDDYAIATFKAPKPKTNDPDAPDPLLAFWREQRDEIGEIKVARTLANPHPLIAAWLKEDERQLQAHMRWDGPGLSLFRTTPLERRRMRVLSALCKALEARGVSAHCERNARNVRFHCGRDRVEFKLWEYTQQKRRPLTEKELADPWNADAKYKQEYLATGFLRGRVESYLPKGVPIQWTETEDKQFDGILGECVASILTAIARAQAQREQWEETDRLRRKREEELQLQEEIAKADRKRFKALLRRARDWRKAKELRDYVTAVRMAANDGRLDRNEVTKWCEWALAHATSLDPIDAGDALAMTTP